MKIFFFFMLFQLVGYSNQLFAQISLGATYEHRKPTYLSNMSISNMDSTIRYNYESKNVMFFDITYKNRFSIEIGQYREEYFVGYGYLYEGRFEDGGFLYIENGKTVPIRLAYTYIPNHRILGKLNFQIGTGVHFNRYSKSPYIPLIGHESEFSGFAGNEFLQFRFWATETDYNQVHSSIAYEGRIKASVRPLKNIEFFVSYGQVWNKEEIGKARFKLTSSLRGTLVEGITTTKGNHTYWGLGGRFFVDLAALKLKNKEEK